MRFLRFALPVAVLAVAACGRVGPGARSGPRVLLLGLEAVDPDLVAEMAGRGELPAFARIAREGASGRLRSETVLLRPVVWTTIATGRDPKDHGVEDFVVTDPVTRSIVPVNDAMRRAEAVWEILARLGRSAEVVSWPLAAPPGPGAVSAALAKWRKDRPDFLAVFADPLAGAEYGPGDEALWGAYRRADRLVGKAVDALGDHAVLLLVSGYGVRHGAARPRRAADPDRRSVAEWHRRDGILLAFGEGVRNGAIPPGATAPDIAPTVLGLLGHPKVRGMPGRFLGEAFAATPPKGTLPSGDADRRRRVLRGLGIADPDAWPRLEALPPLNYPGAALTVADPENLAAYRLSRDDTKEALRAIRVAVRERPDSPSVHFRLGELLQRYRRHREASAEFREAVRLDPGFLAAWLHLARTRKLLHRPREAVAAAERAVAADPGSAAAHLLLGHYLVEAGRPAAGEREIRRVLSLEPRCVAARNRLGILLLRRGEADAAAAEFRRAVKDDPGFTAAWNNLGVTLLSMAAADRTPAALTRAGRTIGEVVARFPDYPKGYYNRARLALLAGDRAAAVTDLRKAVDLDPEYAKARALLESLR